MFTQLEIFAKRLRQARIQNKLSMEQLCSLIGGTVTKQAISKYESAKMMPGSSTLIALAEALHVDLDYFFRPFAYDTEKFEVSFRKKSATSAKDIHALEVQIQDEMERYLEIEEILGKDSAPLSVPNGEELSTKEQMVDCARNLRESWNLGNDAIANVQDMLEERGVKVIRTDAPDGFDGLSGIVNGKHFVIVLNKNSNHEERNRFTALHELAHLLFNNRFSSELTQHEKENLCNAFANEMLLPSAVLTQKFSEGAKIPTSDLKLLQISYGISIDAMMLKLHQIGVIGDSRYKTFCIRKNQDESLKEFVTKSRYREVPTNRFETMVYSAASQGLITNSKAASLLHQSLGRIRKEVTAF